MGHHAVGRRQVGERLPPFALLVANAHARSIARREHVAAAQRLAGPLAFDLDLRVARERRGRGLRQAEIDGVAVIVARKAELEADRGFPNGALHRMLAAFDRAREAFGPGPERGMKAAFAGKRLNDPALRDVRQQPQRPIEARLAAAVGAGDHVEAAERDPDVAQRPVARDGDFGDHGGRSWTAIMDAVVGRQHSSTGRRHDRNCRPGRHARPRAKAEPAAAAAHCRPRWPTTAPWRRPRRSATAKCRRSGRARRPRSEFRRRCR